MASTSGEKRKADKSVEGGASKSVKRRGKAKASQQKRVTGFKPEETWNLKEYERLLEGLKLFAPTSLHSLSRYVRTKTPDEVAAKIASIRSHPGCTPKTLQLDQSPEDEPSDKQAPLQTWLPVFRNLLGREPKDFSENLSDVIGIIGRCEVPRESLSNKLNWKNVYQYISDLLADRQHLQSLTDLESLVILDVMHSMADTLRNSDTQEQRHLMNLKYKYFMADPQCFPQFSNRDEMVAMALSNDFSLVEDEATVPSSISCPSTWTSLSARDKNQMDECGTGSSSSPSPSDTQSNAGMCDVAGPSSSAAPKQTKASSKAHTPSSTSIKDKDSANNDAADGEGSISFEDGLNTDQTASKGSLASTAWTPESGYSRPRFYTLNPFCIPPHLLDFKKKDT